MELSFETKWGLDEKKIRSKITCFETEFDIWSYVFRNFLSFLGASTDRLEDFQVRATHQLMVRALSYWVKTRCHYCCKVRLINRWYGHLPIGDSTRADDHFISISWKEHIFRLINRWCGKEVIRCFSQEGAAHKYGTGWPPSENFFLTKFRDSCDIFW